MINSFIIDDESHAIQLLSEYIEQTPEIQLMGSSLDPVSGLHQVLQDPPDILFLDIDMPFLSGLEFFNLIKGKVSVVFTTAFSNYAVDAYDLQVADFLLKPIRYERFVQCLNQLKAELNNNIKPAEKEDDDFVFVQSGAKAKIIKIQLRDIVYIESLQNYQIIHLTGGHYIVYLSLRELLERLPASQFLRIHKSFIINYTKIKAIEGNRVFIENSLTLNIGTQFRQDFFKKVNMSLLRKK